MLFACTQKPAKVVQKTGGLYNPNYSEVYVETPDGKIARSLRGYNNSSKAQEISIINKDAVKQNDTSRYKYYIVKSGDSLWSISKKHNITIQELASLNNLKKPYNIKPGERLIVYGNKNNIIETEENGVYIVKSGDNLSSIANKFNIGIVELAKLNNLKKPYNIRIGQKLKINSNSTKIKNTTKKTTGIYIVKSGDNLSNIAKKNDMTLSEIAKLNNLKKPYNIRVGQKLKVNKNIVVAVEDRKEQPIEQKTQPKKEIVISSSKKKNSFIWPVKGNIISSFGNKSNGLYNDGINISAPSGTNFKSTEDGVVAYVGNELRGYGTIILIKHNNNWISAYAHCGSVKVSKGDRVQKGDILGTVGQTGNVSTPQLYFSLRKGREAVDPLKYLE